MPLARTEYGVLFGVYLAVVYDVISATNSSPQTTEINASKRASTLMKWVNMGMIQSALFVLIGAYLTKSSAPLVGGGLAMAVLYAQYVYAKNSGVANPGAPTESYA